MNSENTQTNELDSANDSSALRTALRENLHSDETTLVHKLAAAAQLDPAARARIFDIAKSLVIDVRETSDPALMESFLTEYGLSTKEGVAMMCLAEALLRVPDSETVDALIHDKIVPADWGQHLGQSSSSLVNASTWALMLTGSIINENTQGIVGTLQGVIKRLGEPVIRTAVNQAIRELGNQFVLGEDILKALKNSQSLVSEGFTYSYDMLGEAALTDDDAKRYHLAYSRAISTLAQHCNGKTVAENPGISVKLSALFPRYEVAQRERVLVELTARTRSLAMLAKSANIGFNIDAEEADRLDLSLDIIETVLQEPSLAGWDGFGIVVQAYSRRASFAIEWLYEMAQRLDRNIMVRLVKGAYWDTEIKHAQVEGHEGFPVFTRKTNTDISYISCARKLFSMTDRIYPQFATHNAHSIAAILELANSDCNGSNRISPTHYEFQRLHGMGDTLHEIVRQQQGTRCRIYAPVGAHEDLLAYLVRRLLENGANSSFVNQLVDETISPVEIASDPFDTLDEFERLEHPLITPSSDIFQPQRVNSLGFNITDPISLNQLSTARASFDNHRWYAAPMSGPFRATAQVEHAAGSKTITNPAARTDIVGYCLDAQLNQVDQAFVRAGESFVNWRNLATQTRAKMLCDVADLMEQHSVELIELTCREAGKTLNNSIAEIREAVDFLRYYSAQAEGLCGNAKIVARGTFVCISPWNFPVAIFTGQIAAALAVGNCVIAKPAEQTPLVASFMVDLFYRAGIDSNVLQLLPGAGATIGAALVSDSRLAGVCFTGSTATAQRIHSSMAANCDPKAPLIAETGGLNAMIVDSTALPEQAITSIMESAFQSAGQRCSALRVLYVQSDVYDKMLPMLCGAMDELCVGDPRLLSTDLGPLIDQSAHQKISQYCEHMILQERLLHRVSLNEQSTQSGCYLAPTVFAVDGINDLDEEVFGPVLHLARFEAADFYQVIDDINNSGYGLTFGLHTRVDERVQDVLERINAGNLYINRNQIGAIVGSQPFGGKNLSGTGPKAGGPHYLLRFANNSTASDVITRVQSESDQHDNTAVSLANEGSIKLEHLTPLIEKLNHSSPAAVDFSRIEERLRKTLLARDFFNQVTSLRDRSSTAANRLLTDELELLFNELLHSISTQHHPTVDLPGVTGESNRLGMDPAGLFICIYPGNKALWITQIIQALLLGNRAIAIGPDAEKTCLIIREALSVKELPLLAISGKIDLDTLERTKNIDGICCCAGPKSLRKIRMRLARRSGAILPLVTDLFDISPLISEKTLCIDTTAAGGNASLLAEAG